MKKNKLLAGLMTFIFTCSMIMPASAVTLTAYTYTLTTDTVTIANNFIPADTTLAAATTKAAITIKAGHGFKDGDIITVTGATTAPASKTISAAEATSNAAISLTGAVLSKKKGALKITVAPVNATTYKSITRSVAFIAQKSPVVTAAAVTIQFNSDVDDVLTVTGAAIEVGDIIKVYTKGVASTVKAIATGKKAAVAGTVTVALGKNNITSAAGIEITITHKDCSESEKVLIDSTKTATFTAATKTYDITTGSAIAVRGGVIVSGLNINSETAKEKYTITAYDADPTTYLVKTATTASKTFVADHMLGKATSVAGTKGTYVFLAYKNKKFTADLTVGATIWVVNKYTGTTKALSKDYSNPIELKVK